MATLSYQRKLAAVNRKGQKECLGACISRDTIPRMNEDDITQVFKETEAIVAHNISLELSRTEHRILGALLKLGEFLLNLLVSVQPGNCPGISRDTCSVNQDLLLMPSFEIISCKVLKVASFSNFIHPQFIKLAMALKFEILFKCELVEVAKS